ncbi:hypothetical protein VTJ04DRAFT_332 [Mycothermus thermophilus]|uniref:uncharacterized protein n=1 Tax=Humicola insolens TaxID=85995 RepID=UPI003742C90B
MITLLSNQPTRHPSPFHFDRPDSSNAAAHPPALLEHHISALTHQYVRNRGVTRLSQWGCTYMPGPCKVRLGFRRIRPASFVLCHSSRITHQLTSGYGVGDPHPPPPAPPPPPPPLHIFPQTPYLCTGSDRSIIDRPAGTCSTEPSGISGDDDDSTYDFWFLRSTRLDYSLTPLSFFVFPIQGFSFFFELALHSFYTLHQVVRMS